MARKRRKQSYRRRSGFHFFYKIMALLLAMAAITAAVAIFFKLQTVEVAGNHKYSVEQVIDIADVGENVNLLFVSKSRIEHLLLDNLPYVKSVTVHRKLPGTLQISIVERPPLVAIETEETWWILDDEGKILESVGAELAKEYTQVTGLLLASPVVGEQAAAMPEDQSRLESLVALLGALEERDMAGQVAWIDLTAETEVELEYNQRMLVRILTNADFDRKVWILQEMMKVLEEDAQGTIDLRSERGYFRPG